MYYASLWELHAYITLSQEYGYSALCKSIVKFTTIILTLFMLVFGYKGDLLHFVPSLRCF